MKQIISAPLAIPDASAEPQRDFAVVIDGIHIIDSGPRTAMQAAHAEAETHDMAGMLMVPGFINSHDHGRGYGTASRGIPDDTLEAWLPTLFAQPHIDPYLAAAYDGIQLVRSGVTLTAHSHNPLSWAISSLQAETAATLNGYGAAGIRVGFQVPITDQNRLVYDDAASFVATLPESVRAEIASATTPPPLSHDDYFALCADLFAAHHDETTHLVHIQPTPAGGQWCSDALIMRAVAFGQQHNTCVQMHMLETRYQAIYAQRKWGKTFIRHLDDIGALGPWLTLAHMVWADEADFELLAQRGVSIAHNPSSNLRLRSGIAPFVRMSRAGINVGIGLDGHGLDDDQDYLREMRLAWVLSNLRNQQDEPGAPSITASQVLTAGTINGAKATMRTALLGTLAAGKLADVVLIDLDFAPFDLLDGGAMLTAPAALLHLASRRHVQHVMVGGNWVVQEGRCTQIDEQAITEEIRIAVRRAPRGETKIPPDAVRKFYARWL